MHVLQERAVGKRLQEPAHITKYKHVHTQIPAPFNLEEVMRAKASDPSALHVVLAQELERYNALLLRVRRGCVELQQGLKGLVVMSAGEGRVERG